MKMQLQIPESLIDPKGLPFAADPITFNSFEIHEAGVIFFSLAITTWIVTKIYRNGFRRLWKKIRSKKLPGQENQS